MENLANRMKHLLSASVIGVATLGGVAIATPADAFDFSTTDQIGTIESPGFGGVTLSTDDAADAIDPPSVQNFLGLGSGDLDLDAITQAFQGSAIKFDVVAGDQFSFNYVANIFAGDSDYGFVVVDGIVEQLTGGSFNRTFASSGLFAIGIVDIGDTRGDSELIVSNANFTPIPTPALLPGVIGMAIGVIRKRKATATES